MSNLVLETLCDEIRKIKPKKWIDDSINDKDISTLRSEAAEGNQFDPLNLKKKMFEAYENGKAKVIVKRCECARVVILQENDSQQFPWSTWSRIFQWFGKPNSTVWQIYLYASPQNRTLPESGPIGPAELNGGYTFPCSPDCIVIYRYEECTRVLVHELLHAACTDEHSKAVEQKEAATEAWAELFLIAVLAKGDSKKANMLWGIQDHYIQDLNYTVSTFHNVNSVNDYGSRYTTLRTDVFKQFSVKMDEAYTPKRIHISRFTSPDLDTYLFS
jgi:hypothetical protein